MKEKSWPAVIIFKLKDMKQNNYGCIIFVTNNYYAAPEAGNSFVRRRSRRNRHGRQGRQAQSNGVERMVSLPAVNNNLVPAVAALPAPSDCTPAVATPAERRIPDCLDTPRAQRLWHICIRKKWVDEDLHLLISQSQGAVLAKRIGDILQLKRQWPPFEELWDVKNLRSKYHAAMEQKQTFGFLEELKIIKI